ncbi:hypothetical protein [Providencia stuartii]|uniref:hypothetical protein n=1 Tax=Providencia stuartii TaxID=588 RepID=UPI003D7FC330
MSDKVNVQITCRQLVVYCKNVEMSIEDFNKYDQLINADMTNSEIDSQLADIAYKYGFSCSDDNYLDSNEPEEIEFQKID